MCVLVLWAHDIYIYILYRGMACASAVDTYIYCMEAWCVC